MWLVLTINKSAQHHYLNILCKIFAVLLDYIAKAVADGPVGQVLARPSFLKVKTKFHFTESK